MSDVMTVEEIIEKFKVYYPINVKSPNFDYEIIEETEEFKQKIRQLKTIDEIDNFHREYPHRTLKPNYTLEIALNEAKRFGNCRTLAYGLYLYDNWDITEKQYKEVIKAVNDRIAYCNQEIIWESKAEVEFRDSESIEHFNISKDMNNEYMDCLKKVYNWRKRLKKAKRVDWKKTTEKIALGYVKVVKCSFDLNINNSD